MSVVVTQESWHHEKDSNVGGMGSVGAGVHVLAHMPSFLYAFSYAVALKPCLDTGVSAKPGDHENFYFTFINTDYSDTRNQLQIATGTFCSGPGQYVGTGGGSVELISDNIVYPIPLDLREYFQNAYKVGTTPESAAHLHIDFDGFTGFTIDCTITYGFASVAPQPVPAPSGTSPSTPGTATLGNLSLGA